MRSDEFLNEEMRRIFGVLIFRTELVKISSRMIEMKGVIPLPPLTITSFSCLKTVILMHVYLLKIMHVSNFDDIVCYICYTNPRKLVEGGP